MKGPGKFVTETAAAPSFLITPSTSAPRAQVNLESWGGLIAAVGAEAREFGCNASLTVRPLA